VLESLSRAARAARGAFLADRADDAAVRLTAIAEPTDVLAIESPRRERRLLGGHPSFAMRLLKAGAREFLVLAPRDAER
jgi:hypothetical protein